MAKKRDELEQLVDECAEATRGMESKKKRIKELMIEREVQQVITSSPIHGKATLSSSPDKQVLDRDKAVEYLTPKEQEACMVLQKGYENRLLIS